MDVIHLLPDSVANQIAAGEVIQRPASCLKELVENSLDAGASHIRIIVRDAGRTMLQVVDDGCGMSDTDARMAFERHATSKIRTAEDLMTLRTMGFRGEALASICAVAQVEVTTRREEDEVGTLLEIHGSEVVRQEPCQCARGTSIRVKNLFYNIPVRRKFLKTDQTELRNLITDFNHIVLVYPEVQFTFVSNDEILYELTPGTEKQRIEQVFGHGSGKPYTGRLIDIHTENEMISIRGFISKPEDCAKMPQQYFFVNGRYMRHPYFHKAVLQAYSGMLQGDAAPSYFIYFNIEPERIDVNIHPQKTEIKFQDEQSLFQILMAVVREGLGKFSVAPTLDFDHTPSFEMPAQSAHIAPPPTIVYDPHYTPFHHEHNAARISSSSSPNWEKLYNGADRLPQSEQTSLFGMDIDTIAPYQYADKYILLPSPQGLMFIHPYRAHYTVLYEQIREQVSAHKAEVQQVLFPETIDLTAEETPLVEQIRDELQEVGFELEQLTPTNYRIVGVPAMLQDNAAETLHSILRQVSESQSSATSGWQHTIALSLAKSSAIRSGRHLTTDEIRDLLGRLFNLRSYLMTPDGQRIVYLMSDEEINRKF